MPIPKIIHYCWLSGDPYPTEIQKCIDSWHKYMPDYEFRLWDMNTFDCNSVPYVSQAVKLRKWAFASDYIRLWALYNEGGIYLDSDIEVFRSFDPLLNEPSFTGLECGGRVAAWIFGSEPGNTVIGDLLSYYNNRDFIDPDGKPDMTPNTIPVTKDLAGKGLLANNSTQRLDGMTVFSSDYFCPFNPWLGITKKTENSYAKHLFCGAWIEQDDEVQFMRKTNEYINEFVNKHVLINKDKNLYIYGAGILGHLVFEILQSRYPKVKVLGFIVSGNDFGWNEIEGVPLNIVSDFENGDKNVPILIATIPKHHEAIIKEVNKYGFNNVYRLGLS